MIDVVWCGAFWLMSMLFRNYLLSLIFLFAYISFRTGGSHGISRSNFRAIAIREGNATSNPMGMCSASSSSSLLMLSLRNEIPIKQKTQLIIKNYIQTELYKRWKKIIIIKGKFECTPFASFMVNVPELQGNNAGQGVDNPIMRRENFPIAPRTVR